MLISHCILGNYIQEIIDIAVDEVGTVQKIQQSKRGQRNS
jgi:hypothetical protein